MLRFPLLLAATVLLAAGPAAAQNTCNLNGSGPDQVTLTVPSGGTDFDLGSSGEFHDLHVPTGARFEACLTNCDTTSDPVCDVAGYAGGQSAVGRAFTPPIPVVIGSVATCVVTTFQEPFATGTANVQTGELDVVANVSGDVYVTTPSAVCPVCTGTNAGDTGSCLGGATPGAACTTDEVLNVQQASAGNPYRVSRDCLPSGSKVSVGFSLTVTTGTSSVNGLCPGQSAADDCNAACGAANCTGSGNGSGLSQNCCTDDTTKRCFPSPLSRTGTPDAPTPAWPEPTYPKNASETIVSAFCAPGAPGLGGLAVNQTAGLPGPVAFVLPVDSEWILDATPVVGTTTTTLVTTSTTLPPCTTDAECDDADPCTTDTCAAPTCTHAPLTGAAGVSCQLGDLGGEAACVEGGGTLLATLQPLIDKAQTALDQIPSQTKPNKVKKLRKKADKALRKMLAKVNKAANKNPPTASPDCTSALTQTITALRSALAGG